MGRTVLACLVPSSGFFSTRKASLGIVMNAFILLPLSYIAYSWYLKGDIRAVGAKIISNQNILYILAACVLCWVVWWIFSIWATVGYRSVRGSSMRRGRSVIAGLMTLLLVGVTAFGAYYAYLGLDALNFMSSSTRSSNSAPEKIVPQSMSTLSPTAQPTPTETGLLAQERTNILLIGSDSYPGRPGVRTDSMMLVSIDNQTGNKTLISIPRNLEGYQYRKDNPMYNLYPEGRPMCGLECMINTVWEKTDEHKDLFPGVKEPGLRNLQQVISDLTNLSIDRTIVVNIRGFSALVDALGGVDINVPERLPIGGHIDESTGQVVGIEGWIEPGQQHLNGYQAMWFSRSRVMSDDYSRMARQRCMVNTLTKQMNPATILVNFPKLVAATKDNITMDITQEDLQDLETLGERIQKGKTNNVALNNKVISIRHPDYDQIHKMISDKLNAMSASPTTSSTPSDSTATSTPSASTTPTPKATSSTQSRSDEVADLYAHCS